MFEVVFAFLMIAVIGCMSLIGVFMISLKENTLDSILFILVAFATGTILASAIFDLIPEAIHHYEELSAEGLALDESIVFISIMSGFVVFFIMERFIYWFHGHAHESENQTVCYSGIGNNTPAELENPKNIKNFALLNLFGDGMHNFLDGIVIMVAFLTSIPLGIIVTLAVIFHEVPQEIGDFGILIYGGFTKKRALLFNFLSAMVAMFGGLFALILSNMVETFNLFFLAFSGGGFLFLACT